MDNLYETQRLLNEYLLFHYGSDDEVLPWPKGPREALGFARRSVSELIDEPRLPAAGAALSTPAHPLNVKDAEAGLRPMRSSAGRGGGRRCAGATGDLCCVHAGGVVLFLSRAPCCRPCLPWS